MIIFDIILLLIVYTIGVITGAYICPLKIEKHKDKILEIINEAGYDNQKYTPSEAIYEIQQLMQK
jgi:hypothetical protein